MGKVGRARPRKTLAVEGGLSLPMKKLILKLCVLYGMIGYYVPHSIYPDGYHCTPTDPLPFANLA